MSTHHKQIVALIFEGGILSSLPWPRIRCRAPHPAEASDGKIVLIISGGIGGLNATKELAHPTLSSAV